MANEKSTIQDLAESLAARNHCSRTKADTFLRKMLSLIKNGLNSDNFVKIKGFGTFKLVTVSSRESVDVNTGARIEIAEHQRVLFTPDASLKARVNKPFEKFETMIIDDDADLGKLDVDTENDKTEEPEEDQDSVEDIEEAEKVAEPTLEAKEEIIPAEAEIVAEEKPEEKAQEMSLNDNISVTSVYLGDADSEKEDNSSQEVEQVKDVAVPTTPKSSMPTFVVPENGTRKGKKSFLIICLAVGAVVLILVSYAAGYYHWFVAENTVLAKPQSFVIKSTPAKKVYPVRRAFKKELSDSSKTAAVKSEKSQEPSAKELSKQYEQLPGGRYLIIGTLEEHEMKATDTLIKLSKKIYGSKDYVKYIIFYNHLENPDLIPLGTKLKMPKLAHEE